MNNEQIKATESLQRALDKCHKTGLKGGVFDTSFCVWPSVHEPRNNVDGDDFFESVERYGKTINTEMFLDGGAGT